MGIIKKVHYLFGTKKIPLFVYCGPEPSATANEARLSMMEFVHRSGLAQLNDSTWTAIFGVPATKPFRPLENFQSVHAFSSNPIQKPTILKSQETKRRVLGELDPINPLSRSSNSNVEPQSAKPFKKRHFDGSFKCPGPLTSKTEDKENVPNDENSLPRPQPRVSCCGIVYPIFPFRMPPLRHNSKEKVRMR
jgi:hypothetical protein